MSRWPVVAVALLAAMAAGCGGGDDSEVQVVDVTTGGRKQEQLCSPGEHALTLSNGQPARMRVTPGSGPRALVVVLHGAGGTPAGALDAFRGGWDEPGLVLIAPASKGQTWSILRSEQDLDLESVNLALAEAYERCTIDRRRIAVGGFSDGATYALTLGVSNGDLFPAVIALSPGRDRRGRAARRPALLRLARHPRPVLPIARAGDAVVKKLRERDYPVTYRRFRGGHEASPETSAAAVRWFLDGSPLAAARALVERDRAGNGDVERLGRPGGRDRARDSCCQQLSPPASPRAPRRAGTSSGRRASARAAACAPCGDERDPLAGCVVERRAAARGRSRRPTRAAPSSRAGRRSLGESATAAPKASAARSSVPMLPGSRRARARASSRAARSAGRRCGRRRRRARDARASRSRRAAPARPSRRRRAARPARSRQPPRLRRGPRPRRRRARAPRACASARGACGRASASGSTPR